MPRQKRKVLQQRRDFPAVSAFMPSFETAARSLKVTPITAPVRSDVEIETAIVALGREPGGGLVAMSDAFMVARRAPIIVAAARNNVPVVYLQSEFVRDEGLLSYGANREDPSAISVTVEVLTPCSTARPPRLEGGGPGNRFESGLTLGACPWPCSLGRLPAAGSRYRRDQGLMTTRRRSD